MTVTKGASAVRSDGQTDRRFLQGECSVVMTFLWFSSVRITNLKFNLSPSKTFCYSDVCYIFFSKNCIF
jgi:hypothetical protein